MTMIPSVSDPSLSSHPPSIPSPMTISLDLPAPVGPPRVVIPIRQTVSGNTRMSNKKPSFSSVSGLADAIPVTPTESISPNTTNNSEKVGRWSDQEHEVFLEGLTKYGKQWKTIATLIGTRTVVQVRTHAQKYFQKMEKSKQSDGALTSIPSKAVPHHHARPLKTTNSGTKRKSSPSPVSPLGRKKQIKTVATIPSNENIIRKVSLGRGTISPHPEACYPNTYGDSSTSTVTSSENLSTISPTGVNDLDLLEPTWSSDAIFFSEDFSADLGEDPLEWLIDGGMNHLPESSLAAAPMFPEFGCDEISSDIHLMPQSTDKNPPTASEIDSSLMQNLATDPKLTVQSLFLGETA